jgi:hypothetical protein
MTDANPADRPTLLAPLHLRLFALVVDYLFIVVLLELGDQLTYGQGWDLRVVTQGAASADSTWGWLLGVYGLVILRDSLGGRSLGKWITGLTLRRLDDLTRKPGLPALWLRNVPLVLLPVEGALVLLDRQCRRLGDRLAGTVAVQHPRPWPVPRRLLAITILFMLLLLVSQLIIPWNLHRTAAYATAADFARQHPTVTAAVGAAPSFGFQAELKLPVAPQQETALVTLTATGPRGEREVAVALRLDPTGQRWLPETLTVRQPDADDAGEDEAPGKDLEQQPAPPPGRERI